MFWVGRTFFMTSEAIESAIDATHCNNFLLVGGCLLVLTKMINQICFYKIIAVTFASKF